jgi:hypothetical protein
MKTLKQLFLLGILAIFSLSACNLLEGLIDSDNQDKISETLIKQHIEGTWEVTHVSGYEERWNDNLQKHEIFPIDRDVQISPNDNWSSRIKLSNGKATLYGYTEYGWASQGQTDYSVEDNKLIIIFTENGNEERMEFKVQYIDNEKLVLSSPLQSDPSKSTTVTTKRVGETPVYEVTEELIRQHIQGTWEVSHVSGHMEYWNENLQREEIIPINRDVYPSEYEDWSIRFKLSSDKISVYIFKENSWIEQGQTDYSVEDDKIIIILRENEQEYRDEMRVLYIDSEKNILEKPLLSAPHLTTIVTAKRVEDEQGGRVTDDLIRRHIQGTWEVFHISGYMEHWNEEYQTVEIIPIDRDVHALENDEWGFRYNFSSDKVTISIFEENSWTELIQADYSVEDCKIIMIFREDGYESRDEMRVLYINNNTLVIALPLKSDSSKARVLTTKRIE